MKEDAVVILSYLFLLSQGFSASSYYLFEMPRDLVDSHVWVLNPASFILEASWDAAFAHQVLWQGMIHYLISYIGC